MNVPLAHTSVKKTCKKNIKTADPGPEHVSTKMGILPVYRDTGSRETKREVESAKKHTKQSEETSTRGGHSLAHTQKNEEFWCKKLEKKKTVEGGMPFYRTACILCQCYTKDTWGGGGERARKFERTHDSSGHHPVSQKAGVKQPACLLPSILSALQGAKQEVVFLRISVGEDLCDNKMRYLSKLMCS